MPPQEREKQRIANYKPPGGLKSAMATTLSREHPKEVQRYKARLQEQFVRQKMKAASKKVLLEQKLMKRIMSNWAGVGLKMVFDAWAKWYQKRKKHRAKMKARTAINNK